MHATSQTFPYKLITLRDIGYGRSNKEARRSGSNKGTKISTLIGLEEAVELVSSQVCVLLYSETA
jgi:hypothetical protein